MTIWIQLDQRLADRISLTRVPLPVRADTAKLLSSNAPRSESDGLFPGVVALDVADWLAAGNGSDDQRVVLAKCVAVLGYVGGFELLNRHRPDLAVEVLDVAVRHAPDDPSVRALLGAARWDVGHRTDALGHLAVSIGQYAAAGQVSPMLNVLTAKILVAAGRHADARRLLEPLRVTSPHNAMFWDLAEAAEAEPTPTG